EGGDGSPTLATGGQTVKKPSIQDLTPGGINEAMGCAGRRAVHVVLGTRAAGRAAPVRTVERRGQARNGAHGTTAGGQDRCLAGCAGLLLPAVHNREQRRSSARGWQPEVLRQEPD